MHTQLLFHRSQLISGAKNAQAASLGPNSSAASGKKLAARPKTTNTVFSAFFNFSKKIRFYFHHE